MPEWQSLPREGLLALAAAQAGTIEELQALVASQALTIERQGEQVERQARRIAELERRLSRNSGNSSMPPSTDDMPGRTQPPERPERGGGPRRKPGKQPGAPGAHLRWSESPDETVEHFPAGACACGADLAGAADLGVAASHQVHDIPEVSVVVRQHDRHRVRCGGCGAEHVAGRPEGVTDAAVSYGVNLQTLCVYLMVVHAIPVARCAALIEALTGAAPSVGFVHGLLRRAHDALSEVDQRIRALLTLAYAVCLDETPLRVGAKRAKRQLLVACTELYTHYLLGDRDLATFKAFLLPELTGVAVHDRYTAYDSAEIDNARVDDGLAPLVHQLCASHLLRDLADVAEAHPNEVWPTQIADALRGLIHAANAARDSGHERIAESIRAELVDRFRHGVRVGLKDIPREPGRKQPKFRHLLEVLRDREDDVLRFAHDLRVPPTSNQAERDLRPAKTQQKISGRLRCEKVTTYRYRIAGYASTAAKHGVSVTRAIRDALLGRPWMPPTPATA